MCDFVWQRLIGSTYPLETDCVYHAILTVCILCVTITLIVYCHQGTQVNNGGTALRRFTHCIESSGKSGFMAILAWELSAIMCLMRWIIRCHTFPWINPWWVLMGDITLNLYKAIHDWNAVSQYHPSRMFNNKKLVNGADDLAFIENNQITNQQRDIWNNIKVSGMHCFCMLRVLNAAHFDISLFVSIFLYRCTYLIHRIHIDVQFCKLAVKVGV